MRRQFAAGIAAFGLFLGVSHAAEEAPVQELETFVVSGEQPGPGLWKVSKDGHVMWILAALAPLPKDMTWRTKDIEARIAESQEVLYAGNINIGANVSIWKGITLIPAAMNASKIPEGRTLKDVLPADAYQKWLALRLKYIGKDDDVERLRPSLALEQLRAKAAQKSKLGGGPNVYAIVGDLRKKHKVPATRLPEVSRTVRVENPRGMLKTASKIDLPDLDCFIRGLDEIEPGVERTRETAYAWARGDTEKLRSLNEGPPPAEAIKKVCAYALMAALRDGTNSDSAHAKRTIDDMFWHAEQASVQSELDWTAAAQKSIAKNASTFAVLPVGEMFRPGKYIDKLRSLGYTVEEPK